MFKFSLILFALLAVSVVEANKFKSLFADGTDPKDIHAVLVSGVPLAINPNYFGLNYAAEAEIAQTYHLLLDNGVPADNIILFMDGRFADDKLNPFPGTLYTDKNHSRNYNEGLKVDYSGPEQVTPENFLAVIQGEKDKVQGGSGRVLNSNESNRVFFSHESHGNVGYLVFNQDHLTVKELNDAFAQMESKKMFKELVYYVMACRSGSMFKDQLKEDGNIYALTAVKPQQDAYPNECVDEGEVELCYNTQFGKAWLDDTLIHDSASETLEKQFEDVKPLVINSTVSQWGNVNIARQDNVADFEGKTKDNGIKAVFSYLHESENDEDPIPISQMAEYYMLKRQVKRALKSLNFVEHKELEGKLEKMEKEQSEMINKAHSIVQSLLNAPKYSSSSIEKFDKIPSMITQLDCHNDITKFIGKECQKIRKNTFFEKFYVPMVNLCEEGFDSQKIIAEMRKHC